MLNVKFFRKMNFFFKHLSSLRESFLICSFLSFTLYSSFPILKYVFFISFSILLALSIFENKKFSLSRFNFEYIYSNKILLIILFFYLLGIILTVNNNNIVFLLKEVTHFIIALLLFSLIDTKSNIYNELSFFKLYKYFLYSVVIISFIFLFIKITSFFITENSFLLNFFNINHDKNFFSLYNLYSVLIY